MSEEWRAVVGYEGLYEVSDMGRVRSLDRILPIRKTRWGGTAMRLHHGRMMRSYPKSNGYLKCTINDSDGAEHTCYVHRLVIAAFDGVPEASERLEVNHRNGDKTDNRRCNLEYVTSSENKLHAQEIGLRDVRGEGNPQAKLTADQVRDIRRRFARGGITKTALANEHAVCGATISNCLSGRSWGWLT